MPPKDSKKKSKSKKSKKSKPEERSKLDKIISSLHKKMKIGSKAPFAEEFEQMLEDQPLLRNNEACMSPFELEKIVIQHLYRISRNGTVPKDLSFVGVNLPKELFWQSTISRDLNINPMRSNILEDREGFKRNFRAIRLRGQRELFGYKDYLEKVDVEWVLDQLPLWMQACRTFQQDFYEKFEMYKNIYFNEQSDHDFDGGSFWNNCQNKSCCRKKVWTFRILSGDSKCSEGDLLVTRRPSKIKSISTYFSISKDHKR
jgi:hypothetical protein